MSTVSGILLVAGAVFTLLASVGVLRFDDTYARMHAASKGPTLGLLLVALGAGLEIRTLAATVTLVLVVVLQLLTAPVGAHLIGRSIHRRVPLEIDDVDELARDEAATGGEASPSTGDGPTS